MKLIIAPHVVLTDPKTGVLYNTVSGERYESSHETRSLLGMFTKPTSPKDVLSALGNLSTDDQRTFERFIRNLKKNGLLVRADGTASDTLYVTLPDTDLEYPTRTMFSCPARTLDEIGQETLVFVGSPFDLGSTGYPGSRFGPDRMREMSSNSFEYHADILTGKNRGWYSHETDRNVLIGTNASDIGNVLLHVGEGFDAYFERAHRVVARIIERHGFPVMLGGDHSITHAAVRAFNDPSLGIIHIDAHTDLGQLMRDTPHNHGNVFTRLREDGFASHLVQIGIRSFAGKTPVSPGYLLIPVRKLRAEKILDLLAVIDTDRRWYVSLDIDVLDPVYAPGTGTPVPGGLIPSQLNDLLSAIAHKVQVAGCDLVEINPMRDVNDCTSALAIETLLHFLGEVFR